MGSAYDAAAATAAIGGRGVNSMITRLSAPPAQFAEQNNALQALLTGINTAIDMDNILRSVDGDMAYMADSTLANIEMKAQLMNRDFLKDIAYWKSSCPAGTRITDQGPNAWLFQGTDLSFRFGVTADNQFYGRLTRRQSSDAGQVISSVLDMLQPFTGPLRSIVYNVSQLSTLQQTK